MVFKGTGISIEDLTKNVVLASVLIGIMVALVPTLLTSLVSFLVTVFNETALSGVFTSDGLIVYGLFAVAIITWLFKFMGSKK